ncbi:renalase isoform X2 [Clinocottus analis]
MSTSRSPDSSSQSADLGAQYITATPTFFKSHFRFYSELVSAGVLQPLDSLVEGLKHRDGEQHYVTPRGMSSLVKHFLSQSGADLFFERHVTGVIRRGASWEVQRKAGSSEMFDAVVLTMPAPQILQLQGDLGPNLSVSQQQRLQDVVFSSRFAVALFFSPDAELSFLWTARYIKDQNLVFLKHNAGVPGRGPSLVVHSSVAFGLQHLEDDVEAVQPIILQELSRLLPGLPRPIGIKCHKWRYSQVLTPAPGLPAHMTVLAQPPLVCAGDSFTRSNFDGCVASALSALSALRAGLTTEP